VKLTVVSFPAFTAFLRLSHVK